MPAKAARAKLNALRHRFISKIRLASRLAARILTPADSLDHLIGERKQFIRHVEAERLRRPEVYDHLELGRQQHWQVGRLVTPEDATGIAASQAIHLGQVQDPEGVVRPERSQYRSVRGRMPVLFA